MKSSLELQYGEKRIDEAELTKKAQADYKSNGSKAGSIKELKLFAQPQNSVVYYVVNGDYEGKFGI